MGIHHSKKIEVMYKVKRFSKESKRNGSTRSSKTAGAVSGASLAAGGIMSTGLGQAALDEIGESYLKNKNFITGVEQFYHNTDAADNVLKEGIKSKFAEDPNNLTNKVVDDVDMAEKKGKVYLAKRKEVADNVGRTRQVNTGRSGRTLDVAIPYEEFKKIKEVDNPELRGAKTQQEFMEKHKRIVKDKLKKRGIATHLVPDSQIEAVSKELYNAVGKDGTTVIQGDIDSKFLRESKNYKKYGTKDWFKYIKNNPKRFVKGVAKPASIVAGGTAIVGGSAYLGSKITSNKKK